MYMIVHNKQSLSSIPGRLLTYTSDREIQYKVYCNQQLQDNQEELALIDASYDVF